MQKKLTITVDEEVYEGLNKTIGPRKISRFIQELVRPHVIRPNLESAYADMAKDKKREKEALEWAETTFKDIALTSNLDRLYPSEAEVVFEGKESKAMADQLATVSKKRLFKRAGAVNQEDMCKIEEAIKIQLDIH
jgi:predicted CopG family antitoxin